MRGSARTGDPRSGAALQVLWKLAVALALATITIVLVPQSGEGSQPPIDTLLLAGLFVGLTTIPFLYWTIAFDFKLPVSVAVFACLYNLLIVVVKFVFAPRGLYEVNRSVDLNAYFNVSDPTGAVLAGGLVLLLYALGYVALYKVFRRGVGERRTPFTERLWRSRRGLAILLLGAVLMAAAGGSAVLIVPLLLAAPGLEYIDFVFSSGVSLLVAVALGVASALVVAAFSSTAERARLVGDVAVLTGLFFVGLCFLALYHVLWVVYILVLTSTWPLKVVIPK